MWDAKVNEMVTPPPNAIPQLAAQCDAATCVDIQQAAKVRSVSLCSLNVHKKTSPCKNCEYNTESKTQDQVSHERDAQKEGAVSMRGL